MAPRYTLGIGAYAHDSSCALLRDGVLIAMAEEERFNRKKHTTLFPEHAIRFCLSRANLRIEDLADIAFFWNPARELTGNLRHVLRHFPRSVNLLRAPSGGELRFMERIAKMHGVGEELRRRFGGSRIPKVNFVEHHLCHAASAFLPSPFEEAAILTIDGRGECTSTMFARGEGARIRKLREVSVPHSLGHFYASLTHYLGFVPFHDEWKVMGMSAYGTPRYVKDFEELVHAGEDGTFRLNLEYFRFHTHGQSAWLSPAFFGRFGPERGKGKPWDQDDYDIAFALQRTLEKVGVALARRLRELTGLSNLCVAGGVALNCLMNRAIVERSGFDGFFFQPIANDAGTSWGAALYAYYQGRESAPRERLENLYYGPEFSAAEIEEALREAGVPFSRSPDICREAAVRIAEGKIVGWFQGRMECGPRALGNRSIVADPTRPEMKDRLNSMVKRREGFRPFAPSVLAERQKEFFSLPGGLDSPYMMLIGDVRAEVRGRIPAVTHADGTARVQTVTEQANPKFHRLIKEFDRIKGVPLVLNTSFNENEPIVCTPRDAISCFLRSGFDVLAIGDFLVEEKA